MDEKIKLYYFYHRPKQRDDYTYHYYFNESDRDEDLRYHSGWGFDKGTVEAIKVSDQGRERYFLSEISPKNESIKFTREKEKQKLKDLRQSAIDKINATLTQEEILVLGIKI